MKDVLEREGCTEFGNKLNKHHSSNTSDVDDFASQTWEYNYNPAVISALYNFNRMLDLKEPIFVTALL